MVVARKESLEQNSIILPKADCLKEKTNKRDGMRSYP
jgi:hypothetical protein